MNEKNNKSEEYINSLKKSLLGFWNHKSDFEFDKLILKNTLQLFLFRVLGPKIDSKKAERVINEIDDNKLSEELKLVYHEIMNPNT